MKVFLCADIEGSAGICTWKETEKGTAAYPYFAAEMSREVAAACRGALAGGATAIVVKDSHGDGDNIDPLALPRAASLLRGWGCHPYNMMYGLDASFDRVVFTGCHSAAGMPTNALSHTMNKRNTGVFVNGCLASELMINTYTAAYAGVPVCMVAGDAAMCDWAKAYAPAIEVVPVSVGHGLSTLSPHPDAVAEQLAAVGARAMATDKAALTVPLPAAFSLAVEFGEVSRALSGSFYPGARLEGARTVAFDTPDWFEALRFFHFILSSRVTQAL